MTWDYEKRIATLRADLARVTQERDALQAQIVEIGWRASSRVAGSGTISALVAVPADFLTREARRREREEAAEKLAQAAAEVVSMAYEFDGHGHLLEEDAALEAALTAYRALTPEPTPPVREEK